MSPETVSRCREPFFSTKANRGGTGLGLATVNDVVSAAAGTLDVSSTLGVGTTITARFPRMRSFGGTPAQATSDSRLRALLVDDDEQVRRLLGLMLEGFGLDVTEAGSADEAVGCLEAGGYDVVVTDVVMPGRNGVDLVREIDARWPGTATVLVTGYAEASVLREAPAHTSVVMKPLMPDDLRKAVAEARTRTRQGSKR
jgi:CheY-like chemotaxis protein